MYPPLRLPKVPKKHGYEEHSTHSCTYKHAIFKSVSYIKEDAPFIFYSHNYPL